MRREKTLLFVFFILLPTQLTIHFWPDWALVFGIRVDYLSPHIYLSDLVLFLVLVLERKILWNLLLQKLKLHKYISLALIVFIAANTLNSPLPLLSAFKWLTFFKLFLLSLYISQNPKTSYTLLIKALLVISPLVLLMAISQIITGRSLGGIFYWLGERSFTINTPGIALGKIDGVSFLRPYTIFPHPNVLAGFFLITTILLSSKYYLTRFSSIALVLLSFSQNALTAGISLVFLKKLREKYLRWLMKLCLILFTLVSLLLPILLSKYGQKILMPREIEERGKLAINAAEIFTHSPFIGVGLGTFIPTNPQKLILQPVHNLFLLMLSEVGLIGLILFFYLAKGAINNASDKRLLFCILAILLTGLFDHYWLTLQQPQFLFFIVLGLAFSGSKLIE